MRSHEADQQYGTKKRRPRALAPADAEAAAQEVAVHGVPLAEYYARACKLAQVRPEPTVSRVLETKTCEERELSFSSNFLPPASFEIVLEVVRVCSRLRKLDLSGCGLKGDSCVAALCDVLSTHPSLTSVVLAKNPGLGFSAARLLLPVLKQNRRLVELELEGTSMAQPTQDLIAKVLNQNKQAQPYDLVAGSPAKALRRSQQGSLSAIRSGDELSGSFLPDDGRAVSLSDNEGYDSDGDAPPGGIPRSPQKADAPDPKVMDVKRQQDRNLQLLSALLEHEQRIVGTQKELLAKGQDSRPRELKERQGRGMELMAEFQSGWKWFLPSEFGVSTLIGQWGLTLTEATLDRKLEDYTPSAPQAGPAPVAQSIAPVLNELVQANTTRRRRSALVDDLVTRVTKHGPDLRELAELAGRFYDLMHMDGTSIQALRAMLDETEEQIQDLKTKVERAESARQRSMDQEDLYSAEQYYEDGLEYLDRLVDVMLQRLGTILDQGSRKNLLISLRRLSNDADERMNDIKKANDELLQAIDEDIASIQKRLQDEHEASELRHKQFEEADHHAREVLLSNQRQQDKIWKDIAYSFQELVELGEARVQEIESWTKEVEKEERGKVEFNAVLQAGEEHLRQLQALRCDAVCCEDILKEFDGYIRLATQTVTQLSDAASSEGDVLALAEQQQYLQVFRKYYLWLGDYLYKKEKQLEETDRMLRNAQFQIDFAKETLDPNLNSYRDSLAELTIRRTKLWAKVDLLRQKGDERARQFEPHEEALRAAGMEFASPVLELQELTVERRNRALGLRQNVFEKDKEELLDKEAELLQKLVHNTKQAKKTGLASLVTPLNQSQNQTPSQSRGGTPVPAGNASLSSSTQLPAINKQRSIVQGDD
eukprot:TRINITY_DN2885_c0_g1_i2.p1 TRINITY_DN2885_c0_g1~~TRINITY_DN2885_c0_g1_i2.p1  ORF type:complete len:916 (+),score=228.55 TRINITY_DN2885_c0_g1_i2:106-2748(+)